MENLRRLHQFVLALTGIVEDPATDEVVILREGGRLLAGLVKHDDWLPAAFSRAQMNQHQEYLLYCDVRERFAVVSVALAPGQKTPVHDHTTWCLSAVMRGMERYEEYRHEGPGVAMRKTDEHTVCEGEIEAVSPTVGDIHAVTNALRDRPSVSIRVFGANIGTVRRSRYILPTGEAQEYVSGYANDVLPNLWTASRASGRTDVEWSID